MEGEAGSFRHRACMLGWHLLPTKDGRVRPTNDLSEAAGSAGRQDHPLHLNGVAHTQHCWNVRLSKSRTYVGPSDTYGEARQHGGRMKDTMGQRLAALRKANGITQEAVAAEVGISRSTLGSLERDHDAPGRDTLQALATFYDVSMDYLTGPGSRIKSGVGSDELVQSQLFELQQAWPRLDAEGRLAISTLVAKLALMRRKSA